MQEQTKPPALSIFGVPVHALANDLPVGLLQASLIADILHLITGDRSWAAASYRMIQLGSVGAITAGTFGALDYLRLPSESHERQMASAHGLMNLGLVGLWGLNLSLRGGNPKHVGFLPFLLSLIGVGGLGVSTLIGTRLVYEHGVAVRAERPLGRAAGAELAEAARRAAS